MDARRAIPRILLALALVVSVTPAMAKKKRQQSGNVATTQKQAKAKSTVNCDAPTPPFMYNPRFMNRGFLKWGKCPK